MALSKEQEAAFDKMLNDPEGAKEDAFGEWKTKHPKGSREDFEAEWELVTQVFGI